MASGAAWADWTTLRELERELGLPKGSAFRAFRGIEPDLLEGVDFLLLRHEEDRASIAALREQQRIHAGSVNVVLLSEATAERVRAALAPPP